MAKGWSFVWRFNGGWEKRRRRLREREGELLNFLFSAEWRERELLFGFKRLFPLFLLFYLSYATCLHLSGAKRAHLFLLMWLILSHMKRKIWPFGTLKSCLGLRAVSLVPVHCVSLRPSMPVFESRQYIYQNAQNKTPSVVQRLVLLNFKSHAKRWF